MKWVVDKIGKPNNVISSECSENKDCYYKLWKRALGDKQNASK